MMPGTDDAHQIASELRRASPEIGYLGAPGKVDGIETFSLRPARMLTTDEVVATCRLLAMAIRDKLPERSNGWAAAIKAWQYGASPSQPMGIYFIGWAGRADKWFLYEGQERKATDHSDWLSLRERLRTMLTTLGTEGNTFRREGDFSLMSGEAFPREQWLYLHRPEFLTQGLINAIQDVLRDGYAEWMVDVVLNFPPPLDEVWRGIEIRTDGVKEIWQRREVEELLGDRLKI